MADKRDYYEILGVGRDADRETIKKSYRQLALQYHPDRNPGDKAAEESFKEAAEAYEVLSDNQKRQAYDRFGHAGVQGSAGGHSFSSFEDIFGAFGDIFADSVFDGLFGVRGGRRSRGGPGRGASLRCEIAVDLADVLTGVTRTLEIRRQETCDECSGSGAADGTEPVTCRACQGHGEVQHTQGFLTMRTVCSRCRGAGMMIESPCSSCRGQGRHSKPAQIRINVPPGIDDGTQLRMNGQGDVGPQSGPRGDLYCLVHVTPHEYLRRHGRDLVMEMPIAFTQAALGATILVPTLEAETEISIPRGTQTGDIIKIKDKGLPTLEGRRRGSQLVQIFVEVPRKLSARQEELLLELAETEEVKVEPRRKGFFDKVRQYFE